MRAGRWSAVEQEFAHVCFELLASLVCAPRVRAKRAQPVEAPLILGDDSNVLRVPPDLVLRRLQATEAARS